MAKPPRYFATIIFALMSFCAFLIPLILVVYVGHAFFFGPRWLSVQPGSVQILVECLMAILGGVGLIVQWLCFWAIGFILSAKTQYEFHYTRYIRMGKDPAQWGRHLLTR